MDVSREKVCLTSLKRFFRLRLSFFLSLSFLFLLTCPVTNIRLRNLYENSNLAGFRGRAGIVSRRGKALKTSPRPFICSTPFQRWRHNSRGKRMLVESLPVDKVAWNRGFGNFTNVEREERGRR